MVKELLVILIASSLVNNDVLVQILGLCPVLGVGDQDHQQVFKHFLYPSCVYLIFL